MTKNKKKKKSADKKKKPLFKGVAKSLKKLSTTQKVVGGSALVALGVGLLANRLKGSSTDYPADVDANTGEILPGTQGGGI